MGGRAGGRKKESGVAPQGVSSCTWVGKRKKERKKKKVEQRASRFTLKRTFAELHPLDRLLSGDVRCRIFGQRRGGKEQG